MKNAQKKLIVVKRAFVDNDIRSNLIELWKNKQQLDDHQNDEVSKYLR